MLYMGLSISCFEFWMILKVCFDEEILVKIERWIFVWIILFRFDNLFFYVNDKEINFRYFKNYSKFILLIVRDWWCKCKENLRG